ncbi:ShET2/EspL2 family type III secretion system effector toxin [Candidatus Sororendozoicomonas aggregata]|uniref:ShET2/EspL2 family type III secretion system effector toxin n=1 Tax=Candidatus Sororendozoicomonas aggregata TaxID=3073239 RepID=UPI002ED0BD96
MHVGAKGTGPYAGTAPEQTTERGASKKRKWPAKDKAVARSSKKRKLSAENTPACSRPKGIRLLRRKIQQLEKQSRPFTLYRADSKKRLHRSDKSSVNNTSVISYDSKGPVQKLNGRAKNRTDDSHIECRHLAYAFATGGFGVKTSVNQGEPKEPGGKFNAVASIETIQNNAAIKTDQQLEKTPVSGGIPKVAVYFDAERFGQALYDLWMNKGASDPAARGKLSQSWLLETENHSMAIKLVPTACSAIKIEWYDPNYTTIVRRVIVSNEEVLQQLTLSPFISRYDQKGYALGQGRAGILMSTDTVEAQNDSDVTVLAALTPSLLHLLMQHGQLNNSAVGSLKAILSKLKSDNPHELIVLLNAKSADGAPGFFMALQNGHQETVRAYMEHIKPFQGILGPKLTKKLLAAKKRNGTPGLFMALQDGHPEAVSAYLEGIKPFRGIFGPKVTKKLLAAKREDGTPGLSMALQNGHPEAVSAYTEGIKQFLDLREAKAIKDMLTIKIVEGTPGFFLVLDGGNSVEASSGFKEEMSE